MKLPILDRYIIKKFLSTYFFAIAMIIVIIIIFDAAEKMDDFLEAHAPFSEIAFGYYLNFIPYFVNQFSGLFTFVAVIFFTSKMAYDTEIIAMLSSGMSFHRILWPYFLSALMIATFSLMLNLFLIPNANTRRIEFETEYTKKNRKIAAASADYINRQINDSTFVFIRNFNGINKSARYFVLETYKGGSIISSLEAANATFNSETKAWNAPKYLHRQFDHKGNETFLKSTQQLDTVIDLISEELASTDDLIQTMTGPELSRFIDQQERKGSDLVAIFRIEQHSRYAYPISTFILTLIGVALSSRKVRGGTGLHIGVGIALCFSYIILMRFVGEFAKSGALPVAVAMWLPNFIYLIIGCYLYIRAPK